MAAHWVSRCDGFHVVVGRKEVGIVERTVFDDNPLDPVALRVRQPQGRARLIPLTELEAVEPLSRILHFRKRPGRRAAAGRRLSTGATQLRRKAASGTREAATSSSRWMAAQARRHGPTLLSHFRATTKVAIAALTLLLRSLLSALKFAGRMLLQLASLSGSRLRSRPLRNQFR